MNLFIYGNNRTLFIVKKASQNSKIRIYSIPDGPQDCGSTQLNLGRMIDEIINGWNDGIGCFSDEWHWFCSDQR